MQADQVSPYTAAEGQQALEPQYHTTDPSLEGLNKDSPGSGKKKSVIGKVKDKAKKLKTKIKKPKSEGGGGNGGESSSASSSQGEEEGSDPYGQSPHPEHGGQGLASNEDVGTQGLRDSTYDATPAGIGTRGLRDSTYDATPDPNAAPATVGVEDEFGKLNLRSADKLQEEVPSAPGQVSAGVTPYLASHDLDQGPVKKPSEGFADKNQPMDYEKLGDVGKSTAKTSDNSAAWYTPSGGPAEGESEKRDIEEKPLKDNVYDNVAAAGAGAAGALGVKSLAGVKEGEEQIKSPTAEKKGMLEQAREKIFGSRKSQNEGSQPYEVNTTDEKPVDAESKSPTITGRATGTVIGLKDTLASKLGYSAKPSGTESEASGPQDVDRVELPESALGKDDNQPPKSYLQKVQDTALGAKDAVASKLSSPSGAAAGSEVTPEEQTRDQKSYVQKAQESAFGVKDAVASKLGYGDTAGNKDLTGSTGSDRSEYTTAPSRFHPGDEDRALSELITEKMSTSAATVKDTLFRPFSKSSPSTPTTTPPPSSAEHLGLSDTATHTREVPLEGHATGEEGKPAGSPGIVGRMTGAVSSLLGTGKKSPEHATETSGKTLEDPAAGKASEGPVAPTTAEIH